MSESKATSRSSRKPHLDQASLISAHDQIRRDSFSQAPESFRRRPEITVRSLHPKVPKLANVPTSKVIGTHSATRDSAVTEFQERAVRLGPLQKHPLDTHVQRARPYGSSWEKVRVDNGEW
jgi:hypothetical protein